MLDNNKEKVSKVICLELSIITFLSLIPILAVIGRGLILTFR